MKPFCWPRTITVPEEVTNHRRGRKADKEMEEEERKRKMKMKEKEKERGREAIKVAKAPLVVA